MDDLLTKRLPSDEESDDEDYMPTEAELRQDEANQRYNGPSSIGLNRKRALEEIFTEMKNDWQTSLKQHKEKRERPEDIDIKQVLEKINKDKPKPQLIKFAGKTFNLEDANDSKLFEVSQEEKTAQQEATVIPVPETAPVELAIDIEVPEETKVTMRQKFDYLKNLLKSIDAKNINSMTKSRYDWKDYTKKENMEKQFNENRKDGYIEKMKFLEKSKQEEKEYIKSRKKLKT